MSNDLPPHLSDNAKRLNVAVATALSIGGVPTENEVLDAANQLRRMSIMTVTDEEFDAVIKGLHEALIIDMGLGSRVIGDHTPWLQARKASINPFFWSRYQTELRKQGMPPKVVVSLDRVTDDLLDLLGDPDSKEGWPRRGLVMGDVQSGKTSNYTGLVCKAADAGYKLIILLTGTLESLRRQTQERLDAGFVGLDSSGVVNRSRQRREIGVGLINGARSAGVFTSTLKDFKADTVNQLGFKLRDYKEPVLLVVKKNKRILENLANWLINFNASNNSEKIDLPMLLIDDEADNASVNTSVATATAINAGIRNLLNVFPRSSYVGFTATPFANVFIHPDTTDAMIGNDLFPRDFIYALDAPSNYVGARRIFADETELDCIRHFDDAADCFPRELTADSQINELPQSMLNALGCFLVVNAIMDRRGGAPLHRSMLVNVTHLTLVQDQIRDLLDLELRRMQEDVRGFGALPFKDAMKNRTIKFLHALFEQEFTHCGLTWTNIQKALINATLPIVVKSVNQRSGGASLNYSLHKESGLRVIAVGGNSLSRGLTLEGLSVSYFYRSTLMYDALLQMGRWFGYRSGYEDLFRIWMTEEAEEFYTDISEASEELRNEIRRMQRLGLKPIDFGLKVRASPNSLMITARNKMRNSEEIVHMMSVSGEGFESSRLLNDTRTHAGNFRAAKSFVTSLFGDASPTNASSNAMFWTGVDRRHIVDFLRRFTSHPLNIKLQTNALADFVEQSQENALLTWDVLIPGGSGSKIRSISGLDIGGRVRKLEKDDASRSILVNGRRMRVGSPADEKAGLNNDQIALAEAEFFGKKENSTAQTVSSAAYRSVRTRPLISLNFITPESCEVFKADDDCEALVAIGLSFPTLSVGGTSVRYRINLVELRNIMSSIGESDDEDDEDEDGAL